VTDLELIYAATKKQDSTAITELVNRHTGIYVSIVQKYTAYPDFVNKVNVDDLKDDKAVNIYRWAMIYDPSKGMKFGTFVGERIKHKCQNLLRRAPESVELDECIAVNNDTTTIDQVEHDSDIEEIKREADGINDPKFRRVFALRFEGNRVRSWREIGQQMGLSHEAVRKIFNKHLDVMQRHLKT